MYPSINSAYFYKRYLCIGPACQQVCDLNFPNADYCDTSSPVYLLNGLDSKDLSACKRCEKDVRFPTCFQSNMKCYQDGDKIRVYQV